MADQVPTRAPDCPPKSGDLAWCGSRTTSPRPLTNRAFYSGAGHMPQGMSKVVVASILRRSADRDRLALLLWPVAGDHDMLLEHA